MRDMLVKILDVLGEIKDALEQIADNTTPPDAES